MRATWEEALEFVAERADTIKATYGGDSFGGLISSRCTNEELYLFQKFMRVTIGTNNIDSSARYGHLNSLQAMRRVQGTHRWTMDFEDIVAADVLLLVGTYLTESNPITGLKVKEAVKKYGAALVTVESLEPAIDTTSNIANLSLHHFSVPPACTQNVILGLLKAVVEQDLVPSGLKQQQPAYVGAITQALEQISWQDIRSATEIDAAAYEKAAIVLARGRRVIIMAGQGLLRHEHGYHGSLSLLDLLLLTGKLDQPGCGFAPLAEENNDQGAVEMGAIAEFLPGPWDIAGRAEHDRIVALWKAAPPPNKGVSLVEMLDRAGTGIVKAMFIVGENPVGSLPAQVRVEDALSKLDLLVCQELFLTETAALAHVVLPAASSMEKSGTFTNTEGHVQAVRPAIEPVGESRPDWEILSALSILMHSPLEYAESKEILKEIRSLIPGYGSLGPAPMPPRVEKTVVDRYLASGFQDDFALRYKLVAPASPPDGMVRLELVQSLFHSGKLSTRSKGLLQLEADGVLRINPCHAARFALADGDRVRLSNGRGEMTTKVKVLGRVPRESAWFPDHFSQRALHLFDCVIDPVTQTPYIRTAFVSMMKVD